MPATEETFKPAPSEKGDNWVVLAIILFAVAVVVGVAYSGSKTRREELEKRPESCVLHPPCEHCPERPTCPPSWVCEDCPPCESM